MTNQSNPYSLQQSTTSTQNSNNLYNNTSQHSQHKSWDHHNLKTFNMYKKCNLHEQKEHNHMEKITEMDDDHDSEDSDDIFVKWIKTFEMQIKYKVSFDHTIFTEIVKTHQSDAKLVIKLKYDNYKIILQNKDYFSVIKSWIAWCLTLKCEFFRCYGKSKSDCFCDINKFQLFSYSFIIALIQCNTNKKHEPLTTMINIQNRILKIANSLCTILPNHLQKRNNEYFITFKKYITEWLKHEFYNFQCKQCGYINKTIMINRIYEYSISLNYCRFCNALNESRIKQNPYQSKFDMNIAIQQKINQTYNDNYIDNYSNKNNVNDTYVFGSVDTGIRYLSIRPKYASFAQELLLNDMCSINKTEWDKLLFDGKQLHKVYLKLNELESKQTNINYGIEQHEPIGINHFIAVRIFCINKQYSQQFNKIFFNMQNRENTNILCDNCYWMARYLYETVQLFGINFNEVNKPLFYGVSQYTNWHINSFSPVINHMITVTSNANSIKTTTDKKIKLQILPKYDGEIDNTKVIPLRKFFKTEKYAYDKWLFAGGTLQLKIINYNKNNKHNFGFALLYLEKIFTQNIFDVQYYHSNKLYTKAIMDTAWLLIQSRFTKSTIRPENINTIFNYWCDEKKCINLETFQFEKDKMHKRLQKFLYDSKTQMIRIEEIKTKIFPNITSYFDIDGTLKFIEKTNLNNVHMKHKPEPIFRSLYNAQSSDIPYHIINALEKIEFNFNDDLKVKFNEIHQDLLNKFGKALLKRDQVTLKELKIIANSCVLFRKNNKNMGNKLAEFLFCKMLEDKERMKCWKCNQCLFMNRKMMVGGLYRLYNQSSVCGLCGDLRLDHHENKSQNETSMNSITSDDSKEYRLNLPDHILNEWENIDHHSGSSYISHKQLLYILQNDLFNKIASTQGKTDLLNQHKNKIIEYFEKNKMNSFTFMRINRKEFVQQIQRHCNNNKLASLIIKLYKLITQIKICDYDIPDDIADVNDINETKEEESIHVCSSVKRLQIILQYFDELTNNLTKTKNIYPHSMQYFLESLPDYGVDKLLNDIQHITTHKSNHFICKNKKNCKSSIRASRDRNAKQCTDLTQKHIFFNTNNPNDFIYISMLDEAHVLLCHKENNMNMQNIVNGLTKNVSDVNLNNEMPIFSTGVYINYSETQPLHQNLKHEITRNESHSISVHQFNDELKCTKMFMRTNNMNQWKASKTDKKYGIKINQTIQIEHILCIKLYCNYNKLCTHFRQSFYKTKHYQTDNAIIAWHCKNFYFLGRFLTNAIEFYGKTPKNSEVFYHGLSHQFRFTKFSAVFETPTSTSDNIGGASKFTNGGHGIILELSPKYKKEVSFSKYMNVALLSDFKYENEKLFSGMTVLTITNIYNLRDNKWGARGYQSYINAMLYIERITEQNIHQKLYYNHSIITDNTKNKWIAIQNEYLIPMINYQMNEYNNSNNIPPYICSLIQHFFNSKTIIDVSCIQSELKYMSSPLKFILLKKIMVDKNETFEYEIDNKNIRKIFPNLKQYKHYSGYWINLEKMSYANCHHQSISKKQIQIIESGCERNTIQDLSQELQVLNELIQTKEASEHYYKYYLLQAKKWNDIIHDQQNEYDSIINTMKTEEMKSIIDIHDSAANEVKVLRTVKDKNILDMLPLTANLIEIKEINEKIYKKVKRTRSWKTFIKTNKLENWLEHKKNDILKARTLTTKIINNGFKSDFSEIRNKLNIRDDCYDELINATQHKLTQNHTKSQSMDNKRWSLLGNVGDSSHMDTTLDSLRIQRKHSRSRTTMNNNRDPKKNKKKKQLQLTDYSISAILEEGNELDITEQSKYTDTFMQSKLKHSHKQNEINNEEKTEHEITLVSTLLEAQQLPKTIKNREQYLSDDIFYQTFKLTKKEFYAQKTWKQEYQKRKCYLF